MRVAVLALAGTLVSCGQRDKASPQATAAGSGPDRGSNAVTVSDTNSVVAADGPSVVAIVAGMGNDAPPDLIPSALLEAVQNDPSIRVVERDRLRDVLAELRRNNSGLTEPATAARLGKLVAADVMVEVNRLPAPSIVPAPPRAEPAPRPATPPGSAQVRVIDTRTGIILDTFIASPAGAQDPQQAPKRLIAAARRRTDPKRPRQYVGILDVRSEEVGGQLDPSADIVRAALEYDLSQSPDVFLLDRADLQRLTNEKDLADLAVDLKSSTSLLVCGLKRDRAKNELTVTVKLTALATGSEQTRTAGVPDGHVAAAAEKAAATVRQLLALQPAVAKPAPPNVEAERFSERARILMTDGKLLDAARNADVAVAISPTADRRRAAARTWRLLADGVRGTADVTVRLRGAIRADQLQMQLWGDMTPALQTQRSQPAWTGSDVASPLFTDPLSADFNPVFSDVLLWRVEPSNTEALALRRELIDLEIQKCDRLCQINGKHSWPSSDVFGAKALHAEFLGESPQGVALVLSQAIDGFANDPAGAQLTPYQRAGFYGRVSQAIAPEVRVFYRDKIRPPADTFIHHSDPFIRILGLANQASLFDAGRTKHDPAKAQAFLRSSFVELPADDRSLPLVWAFEYQLSMFRQPVTLAVNAIKASDPSSPARLLETLVSETEHSGNTRVFVAHARLVEELLQGVADQSKRNYADRLTALVGRGPATGDYKGYADYLQAAIRNILESLPGGRPPVADPWDAFAQESLLVDVGRDLRIDELLWGSLSSDHFVVLFESQSLRSNPPAPRALNIASIPVTGGALHVFASGPIARRRIDVNGAATLGDDVYFSTKQDGLIRVSGGHIDILSDKDGLPSNSVESVAAWAGKLYIGFKDGLARFDPKGRRFEELASSHALNARSGLDGGASYVVRSILPDPARKCLWLGVYPRGGLWRFEPDSGRIGQVPDTEAYRPSDLVWDGANIDFGTLNGPARFDPAHGTIHVLSGFLLYVNDAMSKPHGYCVLGDDAVLGKMLYTSTGMGRVGPTGFIGPIEGGAYAVERAYLNELQPLRITLITRKPTAIKAAAREQP